jgi:hypothetical protein
MLHGPTTDREQLWHARNILRENFPRQMFMYTVSNPVAKDTMATIDAVVESMKDLHITILFNSYRVTSPKKTSEQNTPEEIDYLLASYNWSTVQVSCSTSGLLSACPNQFPGPRKSESLN